MNDVERYVNHLFSKYKHTKGVQELRDEVLVNLQARIDDEVSEGRSYQEAFEDAVKNLGDVELLIEGHRQILLNPLKRELAQIAVLYTLIPWVLTTACRFVRSGILVNDALTALLIVLGTVYILFLSRKEEDGATRTINTRRLREGVKVVWILWGVYVAISSSFTLGTRFVSNIWFHTSVHISGPYELADLVLSVLLPFASIFVPLYFMKVYTLVHEQAVSG